FQVTVHDEPRVVTPSRLDDDRWVEWIDHPQVDDLGGNPLLRQHHGGVATGPRRESAANKRDVRSRLNDAWPLLIELDGRAGFEDFSQIVKPSVVDIEDGIVAEDAGD